MGNKGHMRASALSGSAGALALALMLPIVLPVAAAAQVAPRAPTREELTRGQLTDEAANRGSRLTVVGGVERAPCPPADPRYANVQVNFADVRFEGLRIVDPAALEDSWREFAGREVPIATLCEVRDRAATMLRQMGYLAAVQVPPQRIERGGTVRFDPADRTYEVANFFAQDDITVVPDRVFATLGAKWEHNAFSGGELLHRQWQYKRTLR